ncbi:MAG: alkaline phosphatase family protein, partial [Elusimicrobia bacterium]|nr:alkaline phosphatase family protein [Elusimicrobiota bacterium]
MQGATPRVLVIGLDSVPPELFFGRHLPEMPFIRRQMGRSLWGPLRSCDPPITVPSWITMLTGKTPKELGIYGFRHRRPGDDYRLIRLADSADIGEEGIWRDLERTGKRICLVGVPPSYPPFPVPGSLVSCFLTPSGAERFTHPPGLRSEIPPDYLFDVAFRTGDRDGMLPKIYGMSRQKFELMKRLLSKEPWDFSMFVDIGPDRMHHAFWKFCDPEHPQYGPGNKYENVLRDYYRFLDGRIADLHAAVDDGRTTVFIVSDHGSKAMKGCFCVNEWLAQNGYLKLRSGPGKILPIEECDVDWGKTAAWGWGGYYARIFINLKGREPRGCVNPEDLPKIKKDLLEGLRRVRLPEAGQMGLTVFEADSSWKGCPSDLMVYFDDLNFRSAGTLGHGKLFLDDNDTGPDDAVHSTNGIFMQIPGTPAARKLSTIDMRSLWLDILGVSRNDKILPPPPLPAGQRQARETVSTVSLILLTHRRPDPKGVWSRHSPTVVGSHRPELLRRCLESIFQNDPTWIAEVVVAVNGEDPDGLNVLARFQEQTFSLKVLRLSKVSRGRARNLAAQEASGDLLYFIDDDAVLPPGAVRELLRRFRRYPEAEVVGGPNLTPLRSSLFQRCAGFVWESPWIAGPMYRRAVQ